MGTKYASQTATGFNASPPSDDGTAVSTNEVKWSFIKTKLADPVKDLADNMNSALGTHFDESVADIAANTTTTAAHHKRTLNVTAAITVSLGDAATMAAGYIVTVKNSHTAAITVDLATGADTLDGTAAGSVSLAPDAGMTFITNAAADGYYKAVMYPGGTLNPTGDTAAGDAAALGYTAVEGLILTGQGSTSDVTLKNDADATVATIPTGTTALKLDGGQLAFPATQAASADVNTLDDYEEGTFSPTIQDASFSDSESQTYSQNDGVYTKVGNIVHFTIEINMTSVGTLSGGIYVANLPFTARDDTIDCTFVVSGGNYAITAGESVTGAVLANTDTGILYIWNAATGVAQFTAAELSNDGQLRMSGHYYI